MATLASGGIRTDGEQVSEYVVKCCSVVNGSEKVEEYDSNTLTNFEEAPTERSTFRI